MNIVEIVFMALVCGVELMTFKQFFDNFLHSKEIKWISVTGLFGLLLVFFLYANYQHLELLNTFATIIIALIMTAVLYTGNKWQKLIFSVLIVLIHFVVEAATLYFTSALLQQPAQALRSNSIQVILLQIVSKALSWLFIRLLIYLYPNKKYVIAGKRMLSFIIYPVVTIVNVGMLQYFELNYFIELDSGVLIILAFASGLALFVGVSVVVGYDAAAHKQDLLNAIRVNEQRRVSMEILMQAYDRFDEESKRIIHDCKNQIINLKYQYQDDIVAANEQAEKLVERLDNVLKSKPLNLNNKAIESILYRFSNKCERDGIDFSTDISLCNLSTIDILDASSMLDNALDNAYRAVTLQPEDAIRYITLEVAMRGFYTAVIITNSKSNPVQEKNGAIVSDKDDTGRHSYGIRNIMSVAEKYGGCAICEYDEANFKLSILLNLSKHVDAT